MTWLLVAIGTMVVLWSASRIARWWFMRGVWNRD